MFDLDTPDEGEILDAGWIADLVASVNASRIAQGDGADIKAAIQEGGTYLSMSDLARYQVRMGIVESAAPAAAVVDGKRRAYWGNLRWLNPVAIQADTDPNYIDLDTDPDNNPSVPFFNPYTTAASAGAGSLVYVVPTPLGWALLNDECA